MTAAGRRAPRWFAGHLVDGAASGGSFALLDERGRRGDMPPLHVHRRDNEAFYGLEGQVTAFAGAEEILLGPGRAALAPRGVPHAYRVESAEARWLVVTAPAGFESFVRAVAEPAPAEQLPPPGVREVRPACRCRRRRPPDHRSSTTTNEREMALATVMAAGTSWPEAAVAIAGVALVGSVAVVVIWPALATWRTRITVARE